MKKALLIIFASFLTFAVSAQTAANFDIPQRSFTRKVPRVLDDVPVQHFPRPGECRIWYPDRVLGEQPPPMKCEALIGIMLQEGAFILMYTGKAYDTEYDWRKDANGERKKEKSGKIPQPVLDILFGPSNKG